MISVVIPIYNEEATLAALFARLSSALSEAKDEYEIVAVDDGSTDESYAALAALAKRDPHIHTIRFAYNAGQTAALAAGIAAARGDTIVTIDSDLENDPADIPRLLAKKAEGYDVVSGWRQGRWQGAYFSRKLPSQVANRLIAALTGVPLHDFGCTLKAYDAAIIKGIPLYGEMHRFIPAYAAWRGARIAEVPVSHSPRVAGTSKYGFGRTFRVLLDLVLLVFLKKYMNRPMHFFGSWGLVSLALGFIAGIAAIVLRLIGFASLIQTPLPTLAALFIIVGIQFVLFGIIAEILMRTYYESQGARPYAIRESSRHT